MNTIDMHFISGLPRSGSTLLAAILRQNPRMHARVSSPVASLYAGLIRGMNQGAESVFIDDGCKQRMLSSLFTSYYAGRPEDVIFDTNRAWCAHLPSLTNLFPNARMICCLRNPMWIIDSFERQVNRHPLTSPRIFTGETGLNVYGRAESIFNAGPLGSALSGLRQAWYGDQADRLIAVRYESLTEAPSDTVSELYRHLGQEPFQHDFEHLEYEEPEYDAQLGMPGLHTVRSSVRANKRATILPPDLVANFDSEFWMLPGHNPKGVVIV